VHMHAAAVSEMHATCARGRRQADDVPGPRRAAV
jgi:hypothetical protein